MQYHAVLLKTKRHSVSRQDQEKPIAREDPTRQEMKKLPNDRDMIYIYNYIIYNRSVDSVAVKTLGPGSLKYIIASPYTIEYTQKT